VNFASFERIKVVGSFVFAASHKKEKDFLMNNKQIKPEAYPLIIQVIHNHLMIYSPDFNYRVVETWRPEDIGQTEMMVLKIRKELSNRLQLSSGRNTSPPLPSSPSSLHLVEDQDWISTRDTARLLQVSEETVRRLADQGGLACRLTPGGHRRFNRKTVSDYLKRSHDHLRPLEGEA
jgi:excisionase family DNA binding protein